MQHLVFEWKKTLAHTQVTPLPVVQDQCESVLDVSKRCVALVLSGGGGGVVDELDLVFSCVNVWSEMHNLNFSSPSAVSVDEPPIEVPTGLPTLLNTQRTSFSCFCDFLCRLGRLGNLEIT